MRKTVKRSARGGGSKRKAAKGIAPTTRPETWPEESRHGLSDQVRHMTWRLERLAAHLERIPQDAVALRSLKRTAAYRSRILSEMKAKAPDAYERLCRELQLVEEDDA